jgi:hypothetical protein
MGVGQATWHTVNDPAYDLTVPLVGYAVKPAGTYNVVVECAHGAFAGATTGEMSNLIVWGTAGK